MENKTYKINTKIIEKELSEKYLVIEKLSTSECFFYEYDKLNNGFKPIGKKMLWTLDSEDVYVIKSVDVLPTLIEDDITKILLKGDYNLIKLDSQQFLNYYNAFNLEQYRKEYIVHEPYEIYYLENYPFLVINRKTKEASFCEWNIINFNYDNYNILNYFVELHGHDFKITNRNYIVTDDNQYIKIEDLHLIKTLFN